MTATQAVAEAEQLWPRLKPTLTAPSGTGRPAQGRTGSGRKRRRAEADKSLLETVPLCRALRVRIEERAAQSRMLAEVLAQDVEGSAAAQSRRKSLIG